MSPDLADRSDSELAALVLADERRAFAVLMRRHEARTFRLVRSHVGSTDAALDIVQESFVAAYLAFGSYDRSRSFGAWLARIALNKCRDWGRRRAVRRFFTFAVPLDAEAFDIADDIAGADVALDDRRRLAEVARALPKLPVQLKEPLLLCVLDGLSQAEAAAILGISEKAVETRIRRARARLAEMVGGG